MTIQSYAFLPDKAYARELLRPWKIVTFCIAMSWLLYGAIFYDIADWDVGVTLLMGGLTYLMAPWSVYVLLSALSYRPQYWIFHIAAALVAALLVVDLVYMGYHNLVGNRTFREANLYASAPLYFMGGAVWLYRGSVKEFLQNVRVLWPRGRSKETQLRRDQLALSGSQTNTEAGENLIQSR